MIQSDAIMDYSNNGHYSTAAKVEEVLAVWEANKNSAHNIRHDHAWSGDTTVAPGAPLSGWDEGMWKLLHLMGCAYDPSYQLLEHTPAHTMIRHFKTLFNLPNQGTDEEWEDNYGEHASTWLDNGEHQCFFYTSKNIASSPMSLSKPSMVSENTSTEAGGWGYPGSGLGASNNIKCGLLIGLQGGNLDVGVGRGMSVTVRPDDDDVASYNNHYKALRDANTPAADYTDPPAAGAEYVVEGNILLVNYENQFRPTTLNADTDRICLSIGWTNHTYAQIKATMDEAIA